MDVSLGFFTAYSFLYGVHKPDKLLDRAVSAGVSCAAITDLYNLYGVHSFIEEAKERSIRPIIGAALTVKGKTFPHYLYCFAENRAGFGRLCEILTARGRDVEMFNPIPHLHENSQGLVLASTDGDVLKSLAGRVKRLYAAINPDCLGGIAPHRALSLPLTFFNTCVFLDESDYAVHRVLRAIGLNKTIGNLKNEDFIPEGSGIFKTADEIQGRLDSWPEAAKGAREIAELCQFNEIFDKFIFPSYGKTPGEELRQRTYDGAVMRYGELGDCEIERIEYELGIIEKMGFAPYFLRIDDIVKMARDNRTCGRGSGAASIVSYSLGITNVDPVRHNLYLERFLNPARPDPPDIDIDFAWDERDDLIKAVIARFGADYCGRVANHNMFRHRSALRETAKAHGLSDGAVTQLDCSRPSGSLWNEIYRIAARIEGLPRGMSMHCGGLVITPDRISRYVPVEKSLEGYPLLAWEKEGTEAAGLVKIDLLGNRSLAVIRDTVKNIKEQGKNNDIEESLSRAVDNKATIDALARGDSMGVFYIESPAMRQLQKKTGRGDFDHIVIHSSIIRPAANKFINEYVRRLKGGKWKPLHPRLEFILSESYGILCYQEDVSKTAIALADFNEADADKLRKVIAKKAGAVKMALYEKQFFDGCRKNGVEQETIQKIWAMMLSFDGYSFCKPHSASYAMVSYQSAYLRVHHPAEFMAGVLSNQGGYYRPHAYIAESRRMGLNTMGPDVNASRWHYYGRGRDLIIGFMAIKGLSTSGAESILEERIRGGNFTSLDDFIKRVKLNRDDVIALCPAGVFDSISAGLSRPLQARRLLAHNKYQIKSNKGYNNSQDLFAFETSPVLDTIQKTASAPQDDNYLWNEYRALGFLRNLHPLALWKDDLLAVKDRVKAMHIGDYTGSNVKMAGWPVTQKDVWTKDGLTMCFLSLEDETAMYETVIFPDIYERYHKLLFAQQPLLVFGQVTNDNGALSLEVKKITSLDKSMLKRNSQYDIVQPGE